MKGLRWFFAEFFVVVCGVIVAFAINSWWMGKKDEKRERVYLLQIHKDLSATRDSLTTIVEAQRTRVESAAFLLESTYSIDLPSDSIIVSSMNSVLNFDPGTIYSSTLTSFVNSGNLDLIVSDTLRSSLVKTADQLNGYRDFTRSSSFEWLLPGFERMALILPLHDYVQGLVPAKYRNQAAENPMIFIHPIENFKGSPTINWQRLFRETEFQKALTLLYYAHLNLYQQHHEALRTTGVLNTALEKHLNL
jgi:hypothetical protein